MGSHRHGNDDSVALAPSTLLQAQEGLGWVPVPAPYRVRAGSSRGHVVTGTTIQLLSRLRPFCKPRSAGDGFPPPPRIEYGAGSSRGHVVTGTTIQLLSRLRPFCKPRSAGDGFPSSRERRFSCPHAFDPSTRSERSGMGSRRHGNDDSVPFGRLRAGSVFSSRRERRLERHARSLDRRWPGDRRCAGVRPERVRRGVRGAGADAGRAAGHAGRGDIERGRGCGGGAGVQSNP